jgi:hypothetical protein
MRPEPYFHPEFGCLAPTSRFRREVRLGFLSLLFGIGIGVVAVTALSTATRDRDSGSLSPVQAGGAGAFLPAGRTNAVTNEKGNLPIHDSQPAAPADNFGNSRRDAKPSCQNDDLTCLSDGRPAAKPRLISRPTQITDLGRLPLGRSDGSGFPPDGSAVTPRAPPTAPNVTRQKTTAGTIGKEDSTSQPRKIPQKTPRNQNTEAQKAPVSYASREDRGRRGVPPDEVRRPYAGSAASPKGFWAWSR